MDKVLENLYSLFVLYCTIYVLNLKSLDYARSRYKSFPGVFHLEVLCFGLI